MEIPSTFFPRMPKRAIPAASAGFTMARRRAVTSRTPGRGWSSEPLLTPGEPRASRDRVARRLAPYHVVRSRGPHGHPHVIAVREPIPEGPFVRRSPGPVRQTNGVSPRGSSIHRLAEPRVPRLRSVPVVHERHPEVAGRLSRRDGGEFRAHRVRAVGYSDRRAEV